jgi:hypothetical protein
MQDRASDLHDCHASIPRQLLRISEFMPAMAGDRFDESEPESGEIQHRYADASASHLRKPSTYAVCAKSYRSRLGTSKITLASGAAMAQLRSRLTEY